MENKRQLIPVEDGEKVSAAHHSTDSDKWIFFCHGFGSNKRGSHLERCQRAVDEGWNGVRFDFKGNGESDGKFIEQSLTSRIKDLKAVVEFFDPENFVFFGSSFGGKVVFHASEEMDNQAVIGKAPVTYNETMDKFKSVVEEKGRFEYIEGKPIDKRFIKDLENYSFTELIKNLDIPVAIFHGDADTTVHTSKSFKAAEELDTDVMLQKYEGVEHKFTSEAETDMRNKIFDWISYL